MVNVESEELIRDLERCEIAAWGDLYRAANEPAASSCGVQLSSVDSAIVAIAAKVEVLGFNRVVGLGVEESAGETALDEIIERYAAAEVPRFFVQLSPVAAPDSLPRWLARRGFARYNNWVKLYRGIEGPAPVETDLRLEVVGQSHAESFGVMVCKAFGWPEVIGPWLACTFGRPGWTHYMAFDGERPAATAALFIAGSLGWLDLASTDPSYRGRGAQSALIARRIADAAAAGCTHLVVETAEQTPERSAPSYRNMLRFGFQVAYIRPNYILRRDEPSKPA